MPRETRPTVVRTARSRSQLRQARRRVIRARWRTAKAMTDRPAASGVTLQVAVNDPRLTSALSRDQIAELAAWLGQKGPVLFLHPEAMRRAPAELRAAAAAASGLAAAAAPNQLARGATDVRGLGRMRRSRDRNLRAASKRAWRRETALA
jgi:hypothetical protein